MEVSYHARAVTAEVWTPTGLVEGTTVAPTGAPTVDRATAPAVVLPAPGPVRARVYRTVHIPPEYTGLPLRPPQVRYHLRLWPAADAPEQALRNAAELAATRAALPERTFDWINTDTSVLSMAGCLTFAPDTTPGEVLEAFNADPDNAVAWEERYDAFPDLEPTIGLLDVAGGVIAVEENGWTGTQEWVLQALTRGGRRAASVFWNVNALRRLTFARDGAVLSSAEWGIDGVDTTHPDVDPEVVSALAGIDYRDVYGSTAKDVLAATRFTGLPLHADDIDTFATEGRFHRVTPPPVQ